MKNHKPEPIRVGELMREARLGKGMSQYELAQATDLTANHIGLIENGRRQPSPATGIRCADALGVPRREWILVHMREDAPEWYNELFREVEDEQE